MSESKSLRLYVGNLPYSAQREDIVELFARNGVGIKDLTMSIDAFTGRNPSYCFVDVHTEKDAELAMQMQGQLVGGRPIKINNKTERESRTNHQRPIKVYDFGCKTAEVPSKTFAKSSAVLKKLNGLRYSNDALSHWTAPALENRRLYVGGLPQIPKQYILNAEMVGLFEGYAIQAVSKLIWPHDSKQTEPGSHFYAFVDLATAEEAANAVSKLNGTPTPYGGTYRVSCSQRNKGSAIVHREQLNDSASISEARVFVGGLPELQDVDGSIRAIFAGHADVRNVGSLITPPASKQIGQFYFYCFVDFDSADEARAAVAAFKGNDMGLIVDFARAPGRDGGGTGDRSPAKVMHRDFSKSWRRQDVADLA